MLCGRVLCCWMLALSLLVTPSSAAKVAAEKKGNQKASNKKKNSARNRQAELARQRALKARAQATARQIQKIDRELAEARQRLKAAQAQMASIRPSVDNARSALESAQQVHKSSAKEQREVEAALEQAQPESSPYGKAALALKMARSKHEALERSIADRLNIPVASREVIEAKKQDPEFVQSRRLLAAAQQTLDQARAKLFEGSTNWVRVSRANQQNREELNQAQKNLDARVSQFNLHSREALATRRIIAKATSARQSLRRQGSAAESASKRLSSTPNRNNKNRGRKPKKKNKR